MGMYMDPPIPKVQWLELHGRETLLPLHWRPREPGCAFVCLVANAAFPAAAVIYCEDELEAFLRVTRPTRWFVVPIAKLLDVVPLGWVDELRAIDTTPAPRSANA